jgi:hypothetical protein
MCVSWRIEGESGLVRRLAIADPTVPKPRIPTRQRAGDDCFESPGLLPEVWNEFSGTTPEDTRAAKSGARTFIYTSRFIDVRRRFEI